jgi:hypothetical protein
MVIWNIWAVIGELAQWLLNFGQGLLGVNG